MKILAVLVPGVLLLAGVALAGSADSPRERIAVLGDSLGAGYGLPAGQSFPTRLEEALRQRGCDVAVLDRSVSGDTTAGGLARLDWMLKSRPDLVIVELGANDALRGLDPEQTRANLDAIIERLKKAGASVLLAGMRAPRNLGQDYYTKFDRIYPDLADKHDVALYPFFLAGVAGSGRLNQADGIHPNAEGVEVIVDRMLPLVVRLVEECRSVKR